MKFGRNLPRNQVPEWASTYIKYKNLKKLIKLAADTADTAGKSSYPREWVPFANPNQSSSTP